MISALIITSSIFLFVRSQSAECPENRSPSELVAVTVWSREQNGSTSYRISDEDLADEHYQRGSVDRQDVVVLLARSPGSCTLGPCTLRLSTNLRESDGAIAHQENVLGIPDGFKDLDDSFYCARRFGDCGAQLPIFRFTRGSGPSMAYAYSLDPSATIPGYDHEGKILCYGWSDSGSVVHPILPNDNGCLHLNSIAHGKITYSSAKSTSYPIGTTATLVCEEGYMGGGQSAVLCVKSGWYPASGLGYCVRQNATQINSGTAPAISSASLFCAALGPVPNGQLLYSGIAIGGRFPQSTRVTVLCNLGYDPFGSIDSVCEEGRWSKKLATCESSAHPKCPPLSPPDGGRVTYSSVAPYSPTTTAQLSCEPGLSVVGVSTRVCTEEGWSQEEFGECKQQRSREKRQLSSKDIGCPPANVIGGTTSYIQSNPAVLYSSGTSVFVMCNMGYTPQGSMSALCQNGVWTPTLGTCTYSPIGSGSTNPITGVNSGNAGGTCPTLPTPLSGSVTYSTPANFGSYSSGTTATLSCNLGYTVSGSLSSTCSNGMWIPSVLGSCIQGLGGLGTNSVLECSNPTVINGVVTYSQGNSFELDKPSGTIATLVCNAGFNPSGSTTSTCQSGLWIPTLGMCTSSNGIFGGTTTGQTCTALFTPFGGTVSYSSGNNVGPFNTGTIATLRCNSGFPQGSSSSTCTNGQWSPPALGTCSLSPGGSTNSSGIFGSNGLTCSSLLAPIGGTLTFSSAIPPYPSGTTVTLQCSAGSTPSGSTMSTCTNGQWTPAIGTCSSGLFPGGLGGATCSAIPTPFGATLSYSNGGIFGPFNQGTTVTMVCSNGFPSGSTMATCTNGQWNPATLGTCSSNIIGGGSNGNGNNGPGLGGNQCPALTTPPGGTISMSNGFPGSPAAQGTIATLICPMGVQGTSSVLCSNGAWIPSTLGTCMGGSSGSGTNGFGSGSTSTSCQTAPNTPFGATLSYSNFAIFPPFPPGTTVTAKCISGATVTGTATATCTNGQWQPATLGTCNGSGSGGSGALTCPSVQQIGGTVDYSDGPFSSTHPSGTTATLLCNSGVPIGSALSTCINGQWVPAIGTCSTTGISTGTQCTTAPVVPIGATLNYSAGGIFGPWNSGSTATLICPFGQTVVGSSTATCNNGVWSTLGSCSSSGTNGTVGVPQSNSSVPCYFGAMEPPYGNISYTNPTPPYPSGTVATLICDFGYTVMGASTSTCTNGTFSMIGSCQKS